MRRAATHAIDIVAVILAVGVCLALNILTVAVLFDAIYAFVPRLSENATQILTGWGGGIIGVIGALVGYRVGKTAGTPPAETED